MDQKKDLWTGKPAPQAGELFFSWITRVSLANLSDLRSLLKYLGFTTSRYDYDLEIDPELIEKFARHTGFDSSTIRAMCYRNEMNIIHSLRYQRPKTINLVRQLWFTSWDSPGTDRLRYCPLCLKTDKIPYFRKSWKVNYITFCSIHNCYLENKCPWCGSQIVFKKIKWDSAIDRCFKCGKSLSEGEAQLISKPDLFFDSYKEIIKSMSNDLTILKLIFNIVWILVKYSTLTDAIFARHPITTHSEIRELWHKFEPRKNRVDLFKNVKFTYLIFGTAALFFHNCVQDKALLETFVRQFFLNRKRHLYIVNSKKFRRGGFICPANGCDFLTESLSDFFSFLVTQR